jgi:hypothetical protein
MAHCNLPVSGKRDMYEENRRAQPPFRGFPEKGKPPDLLAAGFTPGIHLTLEVSHAEKPLKSV